MPFYTSKKINNLSAIGPTIEAIIVPSPPICSKIKEAGKPIPKVLVTALIDTGASSTCINKQVVSILKINAHDSVEVQTPAGSTIQNVYDIGIQLPISYPNIFTHFRVLEADLSKQPYQVLIGRDILKTCTLFYNGADNSFVLHA